MKNTTTQATKPDLPDLSDIRALRIGITGGIGSGKSYVCSQLEAAGHAVFYCDDEAKRIIRTDEGVKRELSRLVGADVYAPDGQLRKAVLAAYLCRGTDYAERVNRIVHPRVAEAFRQFCLARQTDDTNVPQLPPSCGKETTPQALAALPLRGTVFMECALLFETGFNSLTSLSVLVHVSHTTQLSRLMARDNISREKAEAWIALQLPEEEKLERADRIIVNE